MCTNETLKKLKNVIPFRWRVQSFSKKKATASCVAYVDARDIMDLLDEVIGQGDWQSDYKQVKNNLYAGIGIKFGEEWIWKWDCGTESNVEKEKGEASDSFKRAAVKWGASRFLYELPIVWVKANEVKTSSNYPYCVDENGKEIKDLTLYINNTQSVKNAIEDLKKRHNVVSELKSRYQEPELEVETVQNPETKTVPFSKKKKESSLIDKINECQSIDDLRIIREENKSLETGTTKDKAYIKALSDKYVFFTNQQKEG